MLSAMVDKLLMCEWRRGSAIIFTACLFLPFEIIIVIYLFCFFLFLHNSISLCAMMSTKSSIRRNMKAERGNCHHNNSICCKTGNFAILLHKIPLAVYCFTSIAASLSFIHEKFVEWKQKWMEIYIAMHWAWSVELTSTDCCEMDQKQCLCCRFMMPVAYIRILLLHKCHTVNEMDNAMFFAPLLYECISFQCDILSLAAAEECVGSVSVVHGRKKANYKYLMPSI